MSQFNSISPEFRDSLRELADRIASKAAKPEEKVAEATVEGSKILIKIAMEPEIEIVDDEGTSGSASK